MPKRYLVLPPRGVLIANTDIHGNLEDLRALRRIFEAEGPDAHWVILGDIVHGPDDRARQHHPELYGYEDASGRVALEIAEAMREHPGRVHFVLGNHDHGHIGGPHTGKFHRDEVEHLEARLSTDERAALQAILEGALYAVIAPSGLFLSHGSPNDSLKRLEDLDSIHPAGNDAYGSGVLQSFLTHYGQRDDTAERFLAAVSKSGVPVTVVVHGHDRDERGFFIEGERQLCLCIFGAPREAKRYLRADLASHYTSARDLEDGVEIRRLYPPSGDR
jgi:predicted phosphodiesterase